MKSIEMNTKGAPMSQLEMVDRMPTKPFQIREKKLVNLIHTVIQKLRKRLNLHF